jgi:carboxylesterase type B
MSTRAWLLALLALAPACGDGDSNELVVTIESGTVEGAVSGDIRRFLGIPYAAPPKRENRFRAPDGVHTLTNRQSSSLLVPARLSD